MDDPDDRRLEMDRLRAMAHPLRLRLLSLATGQSISAAEASRELGCTQANASYHLRRLHAAGWLVVVERASVRGGQSVRYRHNKLSVAGFVRSETSEHLGVAEVVAQELLRRTKDRETSTPGHLADAELWVSEEAWETFRSAVQDAVIALHHAARPARNPGTIRTSTTIALFRLRKPLRGGGPR